MKLATCSCVLQNSVSCPRWSSKQHRDARHHVRYERGNAEVDFPRRPWRHRYVPPRLPRAQTDAPNKRHRTGVSSPQPWQKQRKSLAAALKTLEVLTLRNCLGPGNRVSIFTVCYGTPHCCCCSSSSCCCCYYCCCCLRREWLWSLSSLFQGDIISGQLT